MAAMTTTPSPPAATVSPSRPIHRKPLPLSNISVQHERAESQGHNAERALSIAKIDQSPKLRASPVSPVKVNFQPENWARPSNISIEGNHQYQPSMPTNDRERELPQSPDAPPPPPHGPAYNESQHQVQTSRHSPDKPSSPTLTSDLPHRTGQEKKTRGPTGIQMSGTGYVPTAYQDSQSGSDGSSNHDANRHSRESETTASTQQQTSIDSSVETSSSSVSGGLNEGCESQVPSDEAYQESIGESSTPETQTVPQLQYHHQPFLPRVSSVPLQTISRHSSKSDLAEAGMAINRHLTPNSYMRRSSLPRPQSCYSLYSEYGPRGRSPGAHSRKSPETRQTSYAELLNVPYPQPAPAPISFDNSHLRNNVGSNASLLSAQKTLEMYRQNVKKTNDFSIQYSFAVFLISTAKEQGLNLDEPSPRGKGNSKGSPRKDGPESSPADLVREAKSILTRLANGGYPFAQYYLADGYASGLFNKGKEDYNAAFPLFILSAKHGHAESAYRAGLCYEFGWGCRKDPAKAVQFLRTAASKNHPGAMTRLGKACLSGDLGENRYREGVKWLKRATESADAMYNVSPYHLGTLFETGYGDDIFKDESYAAELFTQAAELGNAEASYRMGDAYEHGKLNCPRDPALSVHFYTGAAERGHAAAMMGLCAWYMVGADPILEKDEEEAYEWARRSAELGFVKAQYAVGYFTEMGIGCRRDILEANVWYVKAAEAGDERAKQRLAAIRAAVNGGTPMEVAPPRNAKMRKNQSKDDKDCMVM
ncbi:HCP-like protein [Xylariaceae sp. FL0662B]|nr:HCP-like protein [Xylariaceae sp. FL0662B]